MHSKKLKTRFKLKLTAKIINFSFILNLLFYYHEKEFFKLKELLLKFKYNYYILFIKIYLL